MNVVYVVNGSTKTDVLSGTDVTIQREGHQLHVSFPHGDGVYGLEFSRAAEDRGCGLSWLSYGHCDKVERFLLDSDTSTDPS